MAKKNTRIKLPKDIEEIKLPEGAEETIEEFASKADKPVRVRKNQPQYPWEAENVREDVQKTFLVRMPEPVSIKVTWLAQQLGKSKHSIYLNLFTEKLDQEIKKVIKQQSQQE